MLFNSIRFIIFFPTVAGIFYIFPKKLKRVFLLVASYVFYMSWNARYALLILSSTCITYASGLMIDNIKANVKDEKRCRKILKWIVAGCLFLNLGVLFYFKYLNFSIELVKILAGIFGKTMEWSGINVILPVGISFYTFQAIGYTIDVYRGESPAERNFILYALFVSFFPQLVAGPIERSGNLIEQLKRPVMFNYERFRSGVLLMLWGYFLKIVIADRISVFVDTVYANPLEYNGFFLVVGTLLFAVQIYCDFAGYSTIAMGTAEILGVSLMDNFCAPYFSISVAEFWRNWHISLTSWLRDYIYIPLGGNKKGRTRQYINILIVFLISGLWHGASLSFVIWGALNGGYQIIGSIVKPIRKNMNERLHIDENTWSHRLLQGLITFVLVDFSWVFFRSGSIQNALLVFQNMRVYNPWVLIDGSLFECGLDRQNFMLAVIAIGLLTMVDYLKKRGVVIRESILRQNLFARILIVGMSTFLIILFGCWGPEFNEAGFIYFQF